MTRNNWYKTHWGERHFNSTWTKNTKSEVDTIERILRLDRKQKILDLACGFGRHSIEFARRGYTVVGVDLCHDFIKYAENMASNENLSAKFFLKDIRDFNSKEKYDVVLSLFDGAIGYLENDSENLKIFKTICSHIKPNGIHLCHLLNKKYFSRKCPFEESHIINNLTTKNIYKYNKKNKRLMHSGNSFYTDSTEFDKDQQHPPSNYRLYDPDEITSILKINGFSIQKIASGFPDFCEYNEEKPEFIVISRYSHG